MFIRSSLVLFVVALFLELMFIHSHVLSSILSYVLFLLRKFPELSQFQDILNSRIISSAILFLPYGFLVSVIF